MKRQEMKIVEQAFRQRWPMNHRKRDKVVNTLLAVIDDPESTRRERIAASRALMAAEAQNQKDDYSVPVDPTANDPKPAPAIESGGNRFLEIAEQLGIEIRVGPAVRGGTGQRDSNVVDGTVIPGGGPG